MEKRRFKIYVDFRAPDCPEIVMKRAEDLSSAATSDFLLNTNLKPKTKDSMIFIVMGVAPGDGRDIILAGLIVIRDSTSYSAALSVRFVANAIDNVKWLHMPYKQMEKAVTDLNQKVQHPNLTAPFATRWEKGWDLLYPDLYIRIKFTNKHASAAYDKLVYLLQEHEYFGDFSINIKGKEALWLSVKMPLKPEPDFLLRNLFNEIVSLNHTYPVTKVILGMPIC